MKIILFGGAEVGQVATELKMIEKAINQIKPRQVLHVTFARPIATEPEWMGDWFHRHIKLRSGIEYLNASSRSDMAKAKSPLVFLSGGRENFNLVKKIKTRPRLLQLVKSAPVIIGESAGAKVLGAYFRRKGDDLSSPLIKGLNIIKNTIIEPHYISRNRQELLVKDLQDSGLPYALGIDALVAVEFSATQFPKQIKKIGKGVFALKKN